MTPLIPIALFSWPLISVYFFKKYDPQKAILLTVFLGVMFLPEQGKYHLNLLPTYYKYSSISFSLLIGSFFVLENKFQFDLRDIPIIIFCTVSPVMTSLTNGLGLYDGIFNLINLSIKWGIPYYIGKQYFKDIESIRKLLNMFIIGGLIYLPLCLIEMRLSPKLALFTYGYFPGQFLQAMRYGGYRPIVFMSHGLMTSLFISVAALSAFWSWRFKLDDQILNLKISYITPLLIVSSIFCKSVGAIALLFIGLVLYFIVKKSKSLKTLRLFLIFIPLYVLIRFFNLYSTDSLIELLSDIFDSGRLASLRVRLVQEDLFNERTRIRILWGWGLFRRGWPVNVDNVYWINVVDSLFVIISNTYGLVGLSSLGLALCLGPRDIIKHLNFKMMAIKKELAYLVILAIVVMLFVYDSLLNAMINPMYILAAGALMNAKQMILIEKQPDKDYLSQVSLSRN